MKNNKLNDEIMELVNKAILIHNLSIQEKGTFCCRLYVKCKL